MKRKLIWAFALLLAVSLNAPAQERMERGEQHDTLNFFVGEWETLDNVMPSPMGAGGETECKAAFKWMLGDFWLAHKFTGEIPDFGPYEGLGLTTYDAVAGNYVTYWFGSTQSIVGEYRGDWVDDKSLVLDGSSDMQGTTYYERLTWVKVSDNELRFIIEMSTDGQNYSKTMESTYKR